MEGKPTAQRYSYLSLAEEQRLYDRDRRSVMLGYFFAAVITIGLPFLYQAPDASPLELKAKEADSVLATLAPTVPTEYVCTRK